MRFTQLHLCPLKRCNYDLTVFCRAWKLGLLQVFLKKKPIREVMIGRQLLVEALLPGLMILHDVCIEGEFKEP